MRRRHFYICMLPLVALTLVAANSGLHAAEFPFPVYAAEQGVVVRGGPSEAYYATQEMNRGDELMVYRMEGEDWYAIRPPRGSFSLVSANAIADQRDGNGEVVRNGAASRVGSLLNDLQDMVQVRLEKGERIQVLGSQMRDGVKWLRIAPPHGEFRWVHRGDVVTTPPEPAAPIVQENPETGLTVMPLGHNDEDRYASPPLADDSAPAWDAQAANARPLPSIGATDAIPAVPGGTHERSAVEPEIPAPESLQSNPPAPSAKLAQEDRVSPATDQSFARQLFVLEVELGRMVAESPNLWAFGELEQDAARLMNRATTEAEREAVRQLAGRLERFAALRRRFEGLPPVETLLAARTPRAASPLGGLLPNTVAESVSDAAVASESDSRFDAMGLLRPVASMRPDAPKYALVNDTGQIITFVTPAPDVNLQPYLGRRVGVSGTRGFMEEYNHRHVTAGRVMPVGDRIVR